MVFSMSSASLASSGSDARPTQAYTMPWLSSLSKGTYGVHRGLGSGPVPCPPPCSAGLPSLTLRMKQNSELRRLESVLIWMHLWEGGSAEFPQPWTPAPPHTRYPPGAEGTAIGSDLIEARLESALGRLPLAPVDDELSFEMGQELGVLLLLCHAYYLGSRSAGYFPSPACPPALQGSGLLKSGSIKLPSQP